MVLFGAPSASAQDRQPPPHAPRVLEAIAEDSVWYGDDRPGQKWAYRFARVEGESYTWTEIEDPYGGRVLIPRHFFHYIDEQSRALSDGANVRVILTPTRTTFFTLIALILLGLVSTAGLPVLLLRRRLGREREKRRGLLETARQLADSREDERLRIARDLHDGPLQDLHALHMQLGLAVEALARDGVGPAPESQRLRGVQDEAHTVIGELRGMTEALRPPALGPFGLAAALRAHVDRFRHRHPEVAVDLDLDDDGQALPESVRLALFRIAQEAMNNAVKHGQPSRVTVTFQLGRDAVYLAVDDDGPGLLVSPDDPDLAAQGHFGFLGMRERAEAVGGQFSVESPGGGGVRVWITLPRPAADPASPAAGR